MPRFCGGKLSARMACAIGCRPPPPAPCITRKRIRTLSVGAIPQSSELIVNRVMHSIKKRLRPNTPASHPLIGRTIAFETRYEVNTQVLSSLLAPRLPAMCGRATLAMLVSSTSMNAAIATTMAISQGLNFGVQGTGCGETLVAGLSAICPALSVDVHLGIDRHSGSQQMVRILARVKIDADGNPLYHLDVISRGVLGRQQAEPRPTGAPDARHVTVILAIIGIYAEHDLLARLHMLQLRLFEVGRDPDVFQGDQRHQAFAGRHVLADFRALLADDSGGRSVDHRVAQVQPGLIELRPLL